MHSSRFYAGSGQSCLNHLVDVLPFHANATVLDLGCGTGHVARSLAGRYPHLRRIVALDRDPQVVEDLAQTLRLEKRAPGEACPILPLAADAQAIPLPSGVVDCVICRHSFHHFTEPRAGLAEIKRVLAPAGVLSMIEVMAPEEPGLHAFINRVARLSNPGNVRYYTLDELEAMLAESGLVASVCARSSDYVTPLADYYERYGGNGWRGHIDSLATFLLHADAAARTAFHIEGATPEQLSLSLPEALIVSAKTPERVAAYESGATGECAEEGVAAVLEQAPAS